MVVPRNPVVLKRCSPAIVIAGIFYRDRRAVEYLCGLRKIKTVFFQVGLALGFSPREVHSLNYIYDNAYFKAFEKSGKSLM